MRTASELALARAHPCAQSSAVQPAVRAASCADDCAPLADSLSYIVHDGATSLCQWIARVRADLPCVSAGPSPRCRSQVSNTDNTLTRVAHSWCASRPRFVSAAAWHYGAARAPTKRTAQRDTRKTFTLRCTVL